MTPPLLGLEKQPESSASQAMPSRSMERVMLRTAKETRAGHPRHTIFLLTKIARARQSVLSIFPNDHPGIGSDIRVIGVSM